MADFCKLVSVRRVGTELRTRPEPPKFLLLQASFLRRKMQRCCYIRGRRGGSQPPTERVPGLSAVGIAQPDPRISHLLVVHLRIVNQNVEAEPRHREAAGGRKQGVRGYRAIMLGGDERATRALTSSCCIEYVKRGGLPDARLIAHAVERDLSGIDLRGGRLDLRLGGVEPTPALHYRGPRLDHRINSHL